MKKYKIINKQRFYLFISSLFVILFLIVSIIYSTNAHSVVLREDYDEIKIFEGDTLWKIAKRYMPDKYDTRYLVYKLKEFNDLESAYIYPGDTIKVPIINE